MNQLDSGYATSKLTDVNYHTLEVDLENGRVHPRGSEPLPAKARALLTIIKPDTTDHVESKRSLGDALRELNVRGRGKYSDLSTNKVHLDDLGR